MNYVEKLINDLGLDDNRLGDTIFSDEEQIIELIRAIKELHERIEKLEEKLRFPTNTSPGSAYDLSSYQKGIK